MKFNFHLNKASATISASMTTSVLIQKMDQGLFFGMVGSGKAWPVTIWIHPSFSILPAGNGSWPVLLPALCLGFMFKYDGMGQKCARVVASN